MHYSSIQCHQRQVSARQTLHVKMWPFETRLNLLYRSRLPDPMVDSVTIQCEATWVYHIHSHCQLALPTQPPLPIRTLNPTPDSRLPLPTQLPTPTPNYTSTPNPTPNYTPITPTPTTNYPPQLRTPTPNYHSQLYSHPQLRLPTFTPI